MNHYLLPLSYFLCGIPNKTSRWECKLVQPLWKTVWKFLKKLKIELPYDPAIALLGIYPKDTDVVKRRATCTPMFIAAMSTLPKLIIPPWYTLVNN
uniref:Uncharacterized protein n=1 Tax=Ursus maritimus TaxID=29073 RepID=A0A452V6J5_URSMA